MKICVATLCSPDCRPLHDLTRPVKLEYCARHGYFFREKLGGFQIVQPACGWHRYVFERWRWYAELLGEFDSVFGCGTDVLITNLSVKLEDMMGDRPFIVSQDAQMPNSDVMLIFKTPRCIELLNRVAQSHTSHAGAPYLDQSAFQEYLPQYPHLVEVLPQRAMNAYDYGLMGQWFGVHENYRLARDISGNDGQWQPGDFIFHCPGIPMEVRAQAIRQRICSTTQ